MDYWIAAYEVLFVAIVVLCGIVNAQAVGRTGSLLFHSPLPQIRSTAQPDTDSHLATR